MARIKPRVGDDFTTSTQNPRFRHLCEGFPAVTALVSLLNAELDALRHSDRREFDAAKQFVGWAVGVIMHAHGQAIVGRSRVPGGLFTVGAIWSSDPVNPENRHAA